MTGTVKPMTGAMYIAECLKQEGVEKVFGQCGHTNYALIDSCHRLGIEYVSFRHEQMAAHAADAYYRVSHKLAVLNLHLSPGMTNAITGVISAAADGTPMVVIAGNTPSYHHAREPHQGIRFHADASQSDLYRPFSKRVWRIDDAKYFPDVMPRALNVAQTGRPGVVFLDVPMDVFQQEVAAPVITVQRRPNFRRPVGDPAGIAAAADLIAAAKRPVLFVGNGVLLSDACDELRALAELTAMPVATTLIGKGAFPETHPLSLGMTGIWGTRLANETTSEADLVVAIGTAFGEADCSSWVPGVTFSFPAAKLVQIDIEPQEIGKIYPADVGIVGDAKATVQALVTALGERKAGLRPDTARPGVIAARRAAWATELTESQGDAGVPIHPARLLKEVAAAVPDDVVFVTDVGWNKNGAGQQITVTQPRSFITSGGMATMGFAPAAAIGAKLGAPHRKVVCMVGDGGLMSVIGALTTAVELNVPVLWILFNNFCFSTIRTVGTTYFKNSVGTEFTTPDGEPYNPDFMMLAKSFGIASDLVKQPDDLPAALAKALAADVPYLLEVRTRGDVPMPRTGHWDIADFLVRGND
ncbi:MAG: thiamine pyrophosphate-binding protein [Acidobacteria bacterium]|nr:thiamine pyrophosphate-binding protein [Acidobacteriota bacterium]